MNLFVAMAFMIPGTQRDEAVELRAVWLNPWSFDTPAKRQRLLKNILRAKLDTLFVSVPSVAGNFGYSKPADFKSILKEASNLSVHGWLLNHHRNGVGEAR